MGRQLRTSLDRLHPDYAPEKPLDSRGKIISFSVGAEVYARNYAGSPLWLLGKIIGVTGPYSYKVELEDGRSWRRHIDQLQRRGSTTLGQQLDPGQPKGLLHSMPPEATDADANDASRGPLEPIRSPSSSTPTATVTQSPYNPGAKRDQSLAPAAKVVLRRSGRIRHRPNYLKDYACATLGGKGCYVCSFHSVLSPRGRRALS